MEAASAHAARPTPTHPPEAQPQLARSTRSCSAMLLFIISEAMLFGSFFTAYFFIRVVAGRRPWPPEPFEFPVTVAAMNTLILVSSSFTMHYALHSIKQRNRLGLQVGLVVDLPAWALIFLGTQINEYFKAGFAISRRRLRLGLLRPHRTARRARLRRADAAGDHEHPHASAGTSRPRRTWASRWPASTGTSWTSCGSSCS